MTIDPLGLSLIRQLVEADDNRQESLPSATPAYIRQRCCEDKWSFESVEKWFIYLEAAHELAQHLAFMPCPEICIEEYLMNRDNSDRNIVDASVRAIAQQAMTLYRESAS